MAVRVLQTLYPLFLESLGINLSVVKTSVFNTCRVVILPLVRHLDLDLLVLELWRGRSSLSSVHLGLRHRPVGQLGFGFPKHHLKKWHLFFNNVTIFSDISPLYILCCGNGSVSPKNRTTLCWSFISHCY
jgi:hypothetical protein